MEFDKVIFERQSCRNYDPSVVPEQEKLECIIRDASLAPSACNSQPYSFVIAKGQAAKTIGECARAYGGNKFTEDCGCYIAVVSEEVVLPERVSAHVPHNAFADIDIGIVAAYITLSATAQGLSTCMMGLFEQEKAKKALNVPENKRIKLIIAVGYAKPDDVLRVKKRKDINCICKTAD